MPVNILEDKAALSIELSLFGLQIIMTGIIKSFPLR